MSEPENPFRPSRDGYFMQLWGPAAWDETKRACQKKLCFVATDRAFNRLIFRVINAPSALACALASEPDYSDGRRRLEHREV